MIKIFVTGGTFDKDYDEKNGKLYFKDTHMNEILKLGRSKVDVSIETLMMLDSLDTVSYTHLTLPTILLV